MAPRMNPNPPAAAPANVRRPVRFEYSDEI
jgi:hypothetical protein